MKLVSLEIQGFKSFADRVKLRFDTGITGIVGPNGCGKSNVVDAIRWVLGEQRTRNLRSDKMESVLFNGTDKRKRAAMAEVIVTFENTKNILPTDYSTVAITRRLYQGGDSEYLLNGVQCRLKDITNLFLDTGIGPDSYAIIELGMVEDLLTDKQNARRQLFEAAAGIGKYKQRKKETFARLADTQQSLERVEDLLHEIEKNLRSLERQAAKAREYTDVKEAYRSASTRQGVVEFAALEAKLEAIDDEAKTHAIQLAEAEAQVAGLDSELQKRGKDILAGEQALAALQRNLNALNERIQTRENAHALRNERAKYLTDRRTQLTQLASDEAGRRTALETQLTAGNQAIVSADAACTTLQAEHNALAEQVATAQLEAKRLQEALHTAETNQRSAEEELRTLERAHERYETQLQALQRELQRSLDERTASDQQQAGYGTRIAALKQELEAAEAALKALVTQTEQHEQALAAANRAAIETREAQFAAQRLLDGKTQELQLTKGLVESLEGFAESVRWLKQQPGWGADRPLVSDLLSVEEAYKVALEAVLAPWLNHLVVPDHATAQNGIRLLQEAGKGRVPFLVLGALPGAGSPAQPPVPGATPLLSVIDYKPAYAPLAAYLVGNAFLVDALPTAPPPVGTTLVLRNGTAVIEARALSGGSVGLFEGKRVGRLRQLEKLGPEVAALEKALAEKTSGAKAAAATLEKLQAQNPNRALQEAERAYQLLYRQLAGLQAKEDEYRAFVQRISARSTDIENQMAETAEALQASIPKRTAAKAAVEHATQAAQAARVAYQAHQVQLQALTERHNQANIARLQAENGLAQLQREQAYRNEQLTSLTTEAARQRQELQTIGQELEKLGREGQLHDTEIVGLYEERKGAQRILQQREEALLAAKQQTETLAGDQRQLRSRITGLQSALQAVKDRATEVRIQQSGLRERLEVEFMINVAALDPAQVFAGQTPPPLAELQKETLRLREKLQAFGPVNTTAIEAFAEIQERHTFITAQRNDLLEAQANLSSTIAEMDATARTRFEEAFVQIRENFIRVFRTLFTEHDTCDLLLTDPNDPLESPIEILARPKGKRPLSINQLSGGEKTLTATSLLFAIYLLKPAPFCVFDEVDAPLDDANVDKFTNIITEFSENSQFIVVTHNKRTMAKTQVLYGVTMEEAGVSRLLPVDLVALNLN